MLLNAFWGALRVSERVLVDVFGVSEAACSWPGFVSVQRRSSAFTDVRQFIVEVFVEASIAKPTLPSRFSHADKFFFNLAIAL